jgi:hypothetical protein
LLVETQEFSGRKDFEDDVCLVSVDAAPRRPPPVSVP